MEFLGGLFLAWVWYGYRFRKERRRFTSRLRELEMKIAADHETMDRVLRDTQAKVTMTGQEFLDMIALANGRTVQAKSALRSYMQVMGSSEDEIQRVLETIN
ncbi:MAG: hypothetical protein KGL39_25500 [Patescibacteria group bacterium]|nr:hypothetical protein [Patescibacteria group bacterium]